MSGAIQKVETVLVDVGQKGGEEWSKERRDLVKRTVAPDASDAELEMFLHIASRSGLDPLRRQIHFMKHSGRVTIVADINGLQARAAREADFEGISHAVVYEGDDFVFNNAKQEVEKHTSNPLAPNRKILGAWAIVYRKGMKPFAEVAAFTEYKNNNNPLWGSKPGVMIDKVAKSRALRLAYPEQLGNVYESAEVDVPEPAAQLNEATLSKPAMPETTATREAVSTLQRAEPEKVPVVVFGGAAAPKADVVDAETVPSREPGSDDGDEPEPWEAWLDEVKLIGARGEFKRYAERAKTLPEGSAGRKAMSKALKEADARLKAEGK